MSDRADIVRRVIEIAGALAKETHVTPVEITADTPLNEVFDSFAIFEFIIELETNFEKDIDVGAVPEHDVLSPATFASLIDSKG